MHDYHCMTIVCTPDIGIPFPQKNVLIPALPEGIEAACETIKVLQEEGLSVEATPSDEDIAADIVRAFAATEDQPRQMPTAKAISGTPPAALLITKNLLSAYAHVVVEHAAQIRHLVTNKLIIESDNPDAKIRIRALELLGKISDVGLFAERSEVVVTHQSSSELEERLRERLRLLMTAHDAGGTQVVDVAGVPVDLGAELGLDIEGGPDSETQAAGPA